MPFTLRPYTPPDFSQEPLHSAPHALFLPAPQDGVAPAGYHAMSIFPEYFHVGDAWLLAEDSRMDCVAVLEDGRIIVREFRLLKVGDLVAMAAPRTARKAFMSIPTASASAAARATYSLSGRAAPEKRPFPGTMTSCTNCSAMSAPTAKSSGSWVRPSPLTTTPGGPSPR